VKIVIGLLIVVGFVVEGILALPLAHPFPPACNSVILLPSVTHGSDGTSISHNHTPFS
jgi:hypothetical protein